MVGGSVDSWHLVAERRVSPAVVTPARASQANRIGARINRYGDLSELLPELLPIPLSAFAPGSGA